MKKALYLLRNVVELYIPIVAFVVMFVTFILQVFFRYVVKHPLTWTQEIIVVSFVWLVMFGASYTMRRTSHVKFTLVYDKLKPRRAAMSRVLGNLIIVVTFLTLIVPSYKYSLFLHFQMTGTVRISYTYIFMPFVYFVCSIIGYTVPEIVEDLKVVMKKINDSADHKNAEVFK